MKIIICEGRLDDYERIAILNKNELGYDYPTEETMKQLKKLLENKEHRIYVATTENKVVGYIHANDYDLLYAPPLKNIMGIAVDSGYRLNGIGRMLLNAVEQWARDTGASGVRLVSGAARTGAHAFYKACGYTSNKEQKNFKKIF